MPSAAGEQTHVDEDVTQSRERSARGVYGGGESREERSSGRRETAGEFSTFCWQLPRGQHRSPVLLTSSRLCSAACFPSDIVSSLNTGNSRSSSASSRSPSVGTTAPGLAGASGSSSPSEASEDGDSSLLSSVGGFEQRRVGIFGGLGCGSCACCICAKCSCIASSPKGSLSCPCVGEVGGFQGSAATQSTRGAPSPLHTLREEECSERRRKDRRRRRRQHKSRKRGRTGAEKKLERLGLLVHPTSSSNANSVHEGGGKEEGCEEKEEICPRCGQEKAWRRISLPLESPLSVLLCAGNVALPRFMQVRKTS